MKIFAANAIPADGAQVKTLRVPNDVELADLARSGALQDADRIELDFPKFTDGRAFSQAVLLRRRYGFKGEIRATGDVLIDQLLQMQRCGFDSAVLREGQDPDTARRQLDRFNGFYQGDALHPAPLFARRAA
nr:DUF934 domain-containing protein [uncultured Caldimonas sp.]